MVKGEKVAGILDPKVRIIDTVITQEGKRQIAQGGLRAVYASVSDSRSFYGGTVASGSLDATSRIYFETPIESLNDSIIMESDDSGKLLGYPVQGAEFYSTDGLIMGRTSISGTLTYANPSSAEGFSSLADKIVSSSIDRFKNLYTIGTRDGIENLSDQMKIKPRSYTFTINNKFPFNQGPTEAIGNVDYVDPLFFDELFGNTVNFQYLPPLKSPLVGLQKKTPSSPPRFKKLGNYTKIQRPTNLDYKKIIERMNIAIGDMNPVVSDPDIDEDETKYENSLPFSNSNTEGNQGVVESQKDGSSVNLSSTQLPRERVSVFFDKTSNSNNLVMQVFELDSGSSKLLKLDIVKYGEFSDPDSASHPVKEVFFVGKIFINSMGMPVFINLFTIIMD